MNKCKNCNGKKFIPKLSMNIPCPICNKDGKATYNERVAVPVNIKSYGYGLQQLDSEAPYMNRPHETGPVDVMWDDNKKVWRSKIVG